MGRGPRAHSQIRNVPAASEAGFGPMGGIRAMSTASLGVFDGADARIPSVG